MAKPIYVLNQADAWHSNVSYELMGVFTSKKHAIDKLKRWVKSIEDYEPLNEDDLYNLEHINQTQGRYDNYRIEERQPNTIDI